MSFKPESKTTREITYHLNTLVADQAKEANIKIFAHDDMTGKNGGTMIYTCHYTPKPSEGSTERETMRIVEFHSGDPSVFGTNGLTTEAMLAINIDRLEGFQKGKFNHPKNQEAIEHMKKAIQALHERRQVLTE